MRKHSDVNDHRTAHRLRERSNGAFIHMPETLQSEADEAFPFLETISVTVKKHPYAVLAGIVTATVSVIGSIIGAVVFVAIGAFSMYGTQRETLSELKALRTDYAQMSTELAAARKQQTDDMNAVRAYASNDARRTEFIVGLMTPTQQKAVNQFDRVNPRIELPGAPGKREQ